MLEAVLRRLPSGRGPPIVFRIPRRPEAGLREHRRPRRRLHAGGFAGRRHPRWVRRCAVAATVAGLLALPACGSAPGKVPTTAFRARVGDCFHNPGDVLVACARRHQAQTVYVGGRPPGDSALAVRPCHLALVAFLGADVNTRLDLRVWVSARRTWYRCDVLLRKSTHGAAGYEDVTGSLRRTLTKGVPAHLQACLSTRYRPTADQRYVSCSRPHRAQELAFAPAIGVLDEPFPADVPDRARSSCNATASASGLLVAHRSVQAFYPNTRRTWAAGQRAAICWVTADPGARLLPPVA